MLAIDEKVITFSENGTSLGLEFDGRLNSYIYIYIYIYIHTYSRLNSYIYIYRFQERKY